ncbi:MAG: co-chaperone DjlA [Xanthomonadales bacterium]|nr:co-chaperone DjlA [Xanthomonadales bacterium]
MSRIWGKVVGGAVGLMMGGPVGAFVGAALGHAVDTGLPSIGLFDLQRAQRAFFESVFLVMGHIAKSDGRVSEREIAVAEAIMTRMQLTGDQRQEAIKLFNRGKRGGFNLTETLGHLHQACGAQPQLFRLFLEIQLDAAFADGSLKPQGRAVLQRCASFLGVPQWELDRILAMRSGARPGGMRQPQKPVSADPYGVLGVDRKAGEGEIKKAYRRLISQHHPDKLVSKGLPKEMLDLAKDKTAEIRAAYEQIRTERGFR